MPVKKQSPVEKWKTLWKIHHFTPPYTTFIILYPNFSKITIAFHQKNKKNREKILSFFLFILSKNYAVVTLYEKKPSFKVLFACPKRTKRGRGPLLNIFHLRYSISVRMANSSERLKISFFKNSGEKYSSFHLPNSGHSDSCVCCPSFKIKTLPFAKKSVSQTSIKNKCKAHDNAGYPRPL